MTGAELRAERKAAGLSRATLAERAGIGRQAVIYWERMPGRFWLGWAIQRMFEILGLTVLSVFCRPIRARGDGVLVRDREQERLDWLCEAHNARVRARAARYRNTLQGQDAQGPPLPSVVRTGQAALQVPRRQQHRTTCSVPGCDGLLICGHHKDTLWD